MKEIKLKSGATLGLQLSSLEEGTTLLDAILNELVGLKIEGFATPAEGEQFDLKNLFGKDLWALKDVLFKVIASKSVKEAVWVCMGQCTYAPPGRPAERIVRGAQGTFESEKTRADFFPVAGEVMTFNLAPFFENLGLPSSIPEGITSATESAQRSGTG